MSEIEQLAQFAVPVATVGAAFVAGIAGYLAGGWKIREVKLAYEQRIRDSYLENARKVSADVYIPLAIALSRLNAGYLEFRSNIDFENALAPEGAVNRFKGVSRKFQGIVDDLMGRGASAYLTLPLEEEINEFVLFLEKSQAASSVSKN